MENNENKVKKGVKLVNELYFAIVLAIISTNIIKIENKLFLTIALIFAFYMAIVAFYFINTSKIGRGFIEAIVIFIILIFASAYLISKYLEMIDNNLSEKFIIISIVVLTISLLIRLFEKFKPFKIEG